MLILHLLIAELASDGKTKQKYDGVFLLADLYLLLESGASVTAPWSALIRFYRLITGIWGQSNCTMIGSDQILSSYYWSLGPV